MKHVPILLRGAVAARTAFPLLGAALLMVSAPAAAQTEGQDIVTTEDPLTVRIKKADCRELVKHQPEADVAYQPGVDVRGNSVAPADLYGGYAIESPQSLVIPIEIDLFDRLSRPEDRRYEGDVAVGVVEVDLVDGYATFNGQPIAAPAQAELVRHCQDHFGE